MENNHQEVEKKPIKNELKYPGIKAMPFIIGNETFEKLGTIGTSSNLLVYLTSVFHMKTITATNLINIFNGTCNFGTMVGAFMCDSYFGRYNMLAIGSVSSFLGMLVLTLTAAIEKLHPPSCGDKQANQCISATAGQMVFLVSGFAFLVVGASGIRPCNLAFGADQFNPNTKSGERGTSSFFNWFYLTYTFAMMISLTVIVYVQSNISWSIGLALPAFLMFLSCSLFFAGTKLYVCILPEGSPLTSVVQVLVAAFKKRKLRLPEKPELALFNTVSVNSIVSRISHTDQFRCLDKAAIITPEDEINPDGTAVHKWRLCSIQQVEAVKCFTRMIPIWLALIIYFISIVQVQNYVVFQALQSDRRLGHKNFKIPAASYVVFAMLSLTIWIPIFDRILVPALERYTRKKGGITILQRMGIGFGLSILTMLASGLMENNRRHIALTRPPLGFEPRKGAISSMSGLWLIPQLVLSGLSEAFGVIAANEFFYKQSPENMRSIAMALLFCGLAASSYLSSFLSTIVESITGRGGKEPWLAEDLNKGRLDYFYYLIAVLELLNLFYFLLCSRLYKYKEEDVSKEVGMEILHLEDENNKPIV
jgi:peptide/histidine transporter 3/4